MANIFDASRYLLRKKPLPLMKLQRLLYYAQAWSLVWDGAPLFLDQTQITPLGPTFSKIRKKSSGKFLFRDRDFTEGRVRNLTKDQKETLDSVFSFYGSKNVVWLMDLIRLESPWQMAKAMGLKIIPFSLFREYYGRLDSELNPP